MQAWVEYRMERRTSMEVNSFLILLLGIWKYGKAGGQFKKLPDLKSIPTSARHFLQSSELGPPTPSPTSECFPYPFGSGGDTLASERGAGDCGEVPIRTRGQTTKVRTYLEYHRVSVTSSELGTPTPSLACECVQPPPPPWTKGGGDTLAWGWGAWGANSDEWRKSL